MTTIILTSASGAPGVTVTALGLTLCWPRDVLLVDADRTPAQAVLAGYLRGAVPGQRGLSGLLQAHRERRHLLDAVEENRVPLPEPAPSRPRPETRVLPVQRHFLPGFSHLGSVDLFAPVWREAAPALREAPFDVVWDLGRIGTRGLPQDLADASDGVLVVVRSSLASLAALRLYLASLADQVEPSRLRLVVVGPGRPYGTREISEQFGIEAAVEIPWEPRAADDLTTGAELGAKWRAQRLARAYTAAATMLVEESERARRPAGVAT